MHWMHNFLPTCLPHFTMHFVTMFVGLICLWSDAWLLVHPTFQLNLKANPLGMFCPTASDQDLLPIFLTVTKTMFISSSNSCVGLVKLQVWPFSITGERAVTSAPRRVRGRHRRADGGRGRRGLKAERASDNFALTYILKSCLHSPSKRRVCWSISAAFPGPMLL